MRRFRVIVALLLLAVWPVAASHVWLEQLGVIHHAEADEPAGHCDGEHQHCGNHELADGGCRLEISQVTVPTPASVSFAALVADVFLTSCWADDVSAAAPPPNPSPPDLRASWVFHSRAALPVRAPSLAS